MAKLTLVDIICDVLVTSLRQSELREGGKKKSAPPVTITMNYLQLAAHLGVLLPDVVVHCIQRLGIPSCKHGKIMW